MKVPANCPPWTISHNDAMFWCHLQELLDTASTAFIHEQNGGVGLYHGREAGEDLLQPSGSRGRVGNPVGPVAAAAPADVAHQGGSADQLVRGRRPGRTGAGVEVGAAVGAGAPVAAATGLGAAAGAAVGAGSGVAAGAVTGRTVLAALEGKGVAAADLADVEEILENMPTGSLAAAQKFVELMCKDPKHTPSNFAAAVKGGLRLLR